MSTGFVWNELYGWHDTGTYAGLMVAGGLVQPYTHVESPESKVRFAALVEVSGLAKHLTRIEARPATEEEILRIHTKEHLEDIKKQSLNVKGGDAGDGESPFGHGGYEIAALSAGGAIAAIDAVLDGTVTNAYALIRPPGHHARRGNGMGFCIFSNASIAIAHAQANRGIERVAVVDWDVHHGNGTQSIFYDDPSVLTISIHQDDLYPRSSGSIAEQGEGAGEGFTINVPMPAGSGDGAYVEVMKRVVVPALRRFKPQIIVVASGFDASVYDQLGRMIVTSHGYREMTAVLMEAAEELCEGRIMMTHEGGYSPFYVPYCGMAVLEQMSGVLSGVEDPLGGVSTLPDQPLQPHQKVRIDEVVAAHGL
jgi:acetoin utilization deacetylase AcuC-like enzyme